MALWNRKKKKAETPEGAEGEDAAEKKEEKVAEGADKAAAVEAPAEGAEGEALPEDAKKKKIKKLAIIGGAAIIVLLIAGAGTYFLFFSHSKSEPAQAAAPAGEAGKPVYFDLPQILVNLNTGGKGPSFIKASVTLELNLPTDVALAQANLPRLLDSYNTLLREMKSSDLYGSAGVYRLREEMLLRANTLLAPVKVKDVLFKELLVQ